MDYETLLGAKHYCDAWHGGQWSREYRVSSRIGRIMRPSRSEEHLETLARPHYARAREVYIALVKSCQPDQGSGYHQCVCCGHAIVGDMAESGVTMCEDCFDSDCDPLAPCEVDHHG